jgi:diguanylate cyclase (GGDEF)-like protein
MNSPGWLVAVIRRHPWSSSQDAFVLALVMLAGTLLALQYDLVEFWDQYTDRERRIKVEEVFLLSVLLVGGLAVFMFRRLKEARLDMEREAHAQADRALAMQDALTELPNRRALNAALEQALASLPAAGRVHAYYVLDLNGFKQVNDRHGHAIGDELLRAVAKRFRAVARNADLVARFGGDEFGVLARDVENCDAAYEIGERFVAALDAPIVVDGRSCTVGVAVGVALYPDDGNTVDAVTQRADLAMYKAKADKRSNVQVFKAAS